MWRVIRRVLAVLIHAALGRPMVSFVAVVLLVGLGGYAANGFSLDRPLVAATQSATAPSAARTQVRSGTNSVINSPAVDDYLKGMTTFDASLMWRALSSQAIDDMTKQGGSVQALQQRLDQAKQSGARYEAVTYVGGYPLTNGELYLFYVVSRRGFSTPNELEQVYFVFTVGTDGKIIQIQ